MQESNMTSLKFLPSKHGRLTPQYSQSLNQNTKTTGGSIVSERRLEKSPERGANIVSFNFCVLRCTVWVCTVCQCPSPNYTYNHL